MGAGMSGSESQAQPGWRGAPLRRGRALEEARLGPQDPAGRQGKVTKHQDSAELGPVGRSAAHQVHPCGESPLYQRHAVATAHQLQIHTGQSGPFAGELSGNRTGCAGP